MSKHTGRLELTWTNKHLRLLAHEDGTYEWVPSSDYRVAEVRLLNEAGTAGDVHGESERAKDNLLIRGDALSALTSLTKIPEFRDEYVGGVRLIYIDGPFNTGQAFEHYDDALEHSVWLTMMRDRLLQLKKLLAKDGSIWVHCDDYEQHRLRCVLDEVFGPSSFVATVIWQKRYSRDNRPAIGQAHDFIHVYARDPQRWKATRNRLPHDAKTMKQYRNPTDDPKGPWRVIPMDAQGYRENQMYDVVSPTGIVHKPSKGRCWGFLEGKYQELLSEGRIYFGKDGNAKPGVIRYLSEVEGLVPWTLWLHDEVGHNDEAKKEVLDLFPEHEAFDTPKPERLMQRIIHIATNPGDVVLDCFGGSGTTAAVAHKMERRWITAEWSQSTVETFTAPRLTKVVRGEDQGGVTESVGWEGGGGFRVLDVAPSMFDDDDGHVVLAEWAVNGALAEAVAAQFGFAFDTELMPFCGRKGRTRLAVVDGLVNEDVARLLVEQLPENEMLVLCGTMIDPAAQGVVAAARKGSRLRKIPDSILADYRRGQLWWERRMSELLAPSANGDGAAAEQSGEDREQAPVQT